MPGSRATMTAAAPGLPWGRVSAAVLTATVPVRPAASGRAGGHDREARLAGDLGPGRGGHAEVIPERVLPGHDRHRRPSGTSCRRCGERRRADHDQLLAGRVGGRAGGVADGGHRVAETLQPGPDQASAVPELGRVAADDEEGGAGAAARRGAGTGRGAGARARRRADGLGLARLGLGLGDGARARARAGARAGPASGLVPCPGDRGVEQGPAVGGEVAAVLSPRNSPTRRAGAARPGIAAPVS